nr:MAG TPA: hypothetical protein [Caudoviricetes sp.]
MRCSTGPAQGLLRGERMEYICLAALVMLIVALFSY